MKFWRRWIVVCLCLAIGELRASATVSEGDDPHLTLLRHSQTESDSDSVTEVAVPVRTTVVDSLLFYSPYILSQAAVTANGIWNGYLYGQIGGAALQAEAVTLTYEFLIMGTWMGALRATSILGGQLNYAGAVYNRYLALSNLNKAATFLTVVYGAGAMLMFWQSGNIVKGIGLVTDEAQITEINNYFWGFMWGAAPTLLLFGDEMFSLGLRDAKTAGFFATLYAGIASLTAYPLALGKWGAPKWGTTGIGAAMSIGSTTAWLLLRLHYGLSCCGPYKYLNLYTYGRLKPGALRHYLVYAVPLGLTNSVGLVLNFITSQVITGFSTKAAAAWSAASGYFTQLEIVLLGYSSAISAQIANYDPRRYLYSDINGGPSPVNTKNLKRIAGVAVGSSVGLSLVLTIPALIWQDEFVSFFAGPQTPEVEALTKKYLWFAAGQGLANTYSNAVEGVLHGLKDIAIPFLLDITTDSATLGGVALVAKYAEDPLWLGAVGTSVAGITAILYSVRAYKVLGSVIKESRSILKRAGGCMTRCWQGVTSWLADDFLLEEAFQ